MTAASHAPETLESSVVLVIVSMSMQRLVSWLPHQHSQPSFLQRHQQHLRLWAAIQRPQVEGPFQVLLTQTLL